LSCGALIIVGAIIWATIGNERSKPLRRQLPDGSTVTLTKVKYGKELKMAYGNGWQRYFGQILPVQLSKPLGLRVTKVGQGTNTVFFVVETQRTNFSFFPRAMPFSFNTAMVVTDDVSNQFYTTLAVQSMKASNVLAEVFVAPMVSHSATQLNVRLSQRDYFARGSTNQITTFAVPNPAPRKPSKWKPNPLPLTNQIGDLRVVLFGFRPVTQVWLGNDFLVPDASPKVAFYGRDAVNWRLVGSTAEDEDGNIASSWFFLSSQEARKFRFELRHTFAPKPEDCFTISNVMVLDNSTNVYRPRTASFEGHQIYIEKLKRETMNFTIAPPLADQFPFEITFNDHDGIQRSALKTTTLPGGGGMGFPSIPAEAKIVDLHFTFPRTTNTFVEFIAYPQPEVPIPSTP
jgi:hypothetical protein